MNRSSNATYATPGWRGTDPDGGTWVRLAPGGSPWLEVDAHGALHWSSQEEAEAAGLVPLVAKAFSGEGAWVRRDDMVRAVHELCEAIRLTVEYVGPKTLPAIDGWSWFDALVKYAPETAQVFVQERFDRNPAAAAAVRRAEQALADGQAVDIEIPAAPALLDPGNPEHRAQILRQAEGVLWELGYRNLGRVGDLGGIANRLDREAVARAEQDAADRALAEEILAEEYPDDEFTAAGRDASLRLILAGIRAERAREEAGQ